MMRVLVIGSPAWNIPVMVHSMLDDWHRRSCFEMTVVHTGTPGAEAQAQEWAQRPGVDSLVVSTVEAAVSCADVCLAFIVNQSIREADAVDLCVWAAVPVQVFTQWQTVAAR